MLCFRAEILIIVSFTCIHTCWSERASVHSREFPHRPIAFIWFIRINSAHRCTISFSFMFLEHNYSHCLRRNPPPLTSSGKSFLNPLFTSTARPRAETLSFNFLPLMPVSHHAHSSHLGQLSASQEAAEQVGCLCVCVCVCVCVGRSRRGLFKHGPPG